MADHPALCPLCGRPFWPQVTPDPQGRFCPRCAFLQAKYGAVQLSLGAQDQEGGHAPH